MDRWLAEFGFNPCCIGLAIAAAGFGVGSWSIMAFQSLLYWISHCGTTASGSRSRQWTRFNPCCIGLAIAARSW